MKIFGTVLALSLVVGVYLYKHKKEELQVEVTQDFSINNCLKVLNPLSDIKYYKKYDKQQQQLTKVSGHPESIEREISEYEYSIHSTNNYYKVVDKKDNEYFIKNLLYPELSFKVSDKLIKGEKVSCPKQSKLKTYVKGECIRQENKLGKLDHFWKIISSNEDFYEVQGIYDIYLSDLVMKEGMNSPVFKYYNPEVTYPLRLTKIQVDRLATKVACPDTLEVKFKEADCFKETNNKIVYKVINVNSDSGVYETEIVKTLTTEEGRSVASSESMDDELIGFQKSKLDYGLKDFFFYQNEKMNAIDCNPK